MKRLAYIVLTALGASGVWFNWWRAPAFEDELKAPVALEPARAPKLTLPAQTAASGPAKPETETETEPQSTLPPPQVERQTTPSLQQTTNVLLVGLDRKPGQTKGGRPDTIVVAALDKNSGHLGLISVPRDLYVDIPEHGEDRINATFSVAWNRKENAWDLLERVLEDTLQLPIQHRIAVDMSGFESVIEALGGVDVRIPCPIVDNFIDSRTKTGRRLLNLEAGVRHLDGIEAALYVRSRHGRSDWSRARRQQAVLFGIKNRFTSMDGITKLPEFYDALRKVVNSNMTRAQMFALAGHASSLSPGRIHGLVLGVKQAAPHYTDEGKAVLLPDYAAIDAALEGLFTRSLPGTRPTAAACPDAEVALNRGKNSKKKLTRLAQTSKPDEPDAASAGQDEPPLAAAPSP